MSIPGVEEVDGKLKATARGIEPPTGWTNSFEELGGEESWGKNGYMETLLASSGISAMDMKPLFAMEAWTGGDMQLFEAGSPTEFYFHSPIDSSIHKITGLDTLEKIVAWMNDEDKGGYSSILTEQVV